MVDATLLERYDTNIPDNVKQTSARIDALDSELMAGALEQRFATEKRLEEMLLEVTAYFSFFSHLYKRWEAIQDNQEAETYMQVKARSEATSEKFVSAAADREASAAVKEIRYVVNYYEGEVARCEQYMNSVKRILDKERREVA